MIIHRIQQDFLKDWFFAKPRKPIIIRGARQVGKSTLVRHFAKAEGLRLAEVNLEEHRTQVRDVFESGTPAEILAVCARVSGLKLADQHDDVVLFLDEIQTIPAALQSLRYLYEKYPGLAVVAAGSVLEFTLASPTFSMPVGRVTYLFVPPLTFKEFLRAGARQDLASAMESARPDRPESLRTETHEEIMRYLREFMLVGGMPESSALYLQNRQQGASEFSPSPSFRDVHRDILRSYRDDIQKYPATSHIRDVLRDVFDRAPSQLGQKVKFSHLAPHEPSRDVKKALDLLVDAGLIHEIIHTDAGGVPLAADEDRNVRKLFHLDVGLLLTQLGLDSPKYIPDDGDRLVNEGVLAEQFVAQELLARGNGRVRNGLHYWLREKKSLNAEVDFILSRGRRIVPVEVKAGPFGQMKSLWEFCKARRSPVVVRFDAGLPSLHRHLIPHEGKSIPVTLVTLPLYLAGEIDRLLDECLPSGDS